MTAPSPRLAATLANWKKLATKIREDAARTDFDERRCLETKAAQLEACLLDVEEDIAFLLALVEKLLPLRKYAMHRAHCVNPPSPCSCGLDELQSDIGAALVEGREP